MFYKISQQKSLKSSELESLSFHTHHSYLLSHSSDLSLFSYLFSSYSFALRSKIDFLCKRALSASFLLSSLSLVLPTPSTSSSSSVKNKIKRVPLNKNLLKKEAKIFSSKKLFDTSFPLAQLEEMSHSKLEIKSNNLLKSLKSNNSPEEFEVNLDENLSLHSHSFSPSKNFPYNNDDNDNNDNIDNELSQRREYSLMTSQDDFIQNNNNENILKNYKNKEDDKIVISSKDFSKSISENGKKLSKRPIFKNIKESLFSVLISDSFKKIKLCSEEAFQNNNNSNINNNNNNSFENSFNGEMEEVRASAEVASKSSFPESSSRGSGVGMGSELMISPVKKGKFEINSWFREILEMKKIEGEGVDFEGLMIEIGGKGNRELVSDCFMEVLKMTGDEEIEVKQNEENIFIGW